MVPIYKWNGSCNWLVVHPSTCSHDPKVAAQLAHDHAVKEGRDGSYETGVQDTWHNRQNMVMKLKSETLPPGIIVAAYGPGKPVAHNREYIDETHRLCLQAIMANPHASVTVIGLHLPERGDDPRMDKVFDAFCQVHGYKTYVGPDPAERKRAETWGFKVEEMTLHEYLALKQAR